MSKNKKQTTENFEEENSDFISKPLRNLRNKHQRFKKRDQEVIFQQSNVDK